MTLGSQKSR